LANDLLRGRQTLAALTNQSGGTVNAGDVVIVSLANASSFTTTTTANYASAFVGVAVETIAASATGRVCLFGYVPQINLNASASLGQYLATSTTAKQAAPTSTQGAGVFGQVLGTGTSPAAVLFGYPQQAGSGGSGSTVHTICVQDQKTSGTNGGASTAAAWTDRTLNTIVLDDGSLASLASNHLTVPSGTYLVTASAPFNYAGHSQIRLYDVTHSAVLALGTDMFDNQAGTAVFSVLSVIQAAFTLSASSALALQYYVAGNWSGSTQSLGAATGGGTEVYAQLQLLKIA
jgi:hypothetical protein